MTTRAALYLVSACASAEEFVAAFRRYADRTGVFVPAAEPLPAGRRGRLALTLRDGGVMVEGEAEIVQSSSKPVGLYGRAGMLVKFVEPDDFSKVVLAELEKARLAMRPQPTTVPPRPAEVPAAPRPVTPPVGGRIDAANALAECVVIGDASALVEVAGVAKSAADQSGGLPRAGQKFVVPSIPAMGGRPKTPTTPPAADASGAAKATALGVAPLDRPVTIEPTRPKPTALGVAPLEKPNAAAPPAAAATATPTTAAAATTIEPSSGVPKADPTPPPSTSGPAAKAPPRNPTSIGFPAVRPPAVMIEAPTIVGGPPAPPAPSPVPATEAAASPASARMTRIGFPVVDPKLPAATPAAPTPAAPAPAPAKPSKPTDTQPFRTVGDAGETRPPAAAKGPPPPRRAHNPSTPPMPRHPTPVAPLPVTRPPAKPAPAFEVDEVSENTDITSFSPHPLVGEEQKKTSLGVQMMTAAPVGSPSASIASATAPTAEVAVPQVDPLASTQVSAPIQTTPTTPAASTARSGGMRASEILAAVQANEDWTMTPDASGPTVMPASLTPVVVPEPTPAPAAPPGPPTGDWIAANDPNSGWSEPEKLTPPAPPVVAPAPVPKPAAAIVTRTPSTGNPVHAVAKDQGFMAQTWEDRPTNIGEAKIEVDSTLMEPLKPMPPVLDDGFAETGISHHGYADPPAGNDMHGRAATLPPGMRPGTGQSAVHPGTGPMAVHPGTGQMPVHPGPMYPAAGQPGAMSGPFGGQQGFGDFGANPAPGAQPAYPRNRQTGGNGVYGGSGGFDNLGDDERARAGKNKLILLGAGAVAILALVVVAIVMLASGSKSGTAAASKPAHATGSADSSASATNSANAANGTNAGSGETGASPSGAGAPVATGSDTATAAVGSAAGNAAAGNTGSAAAGNTGNAATGTGAAGNTAAGNAAGGNGAAGAASCSVQVTSNPTGAEVALDKTVLGTTPGTFELPCGAPAKLAIRKPRFLGVVKEVTPTASGAKVAVRLTAPVFAVKVTSTPAGATITVGGKMMGVTPTTIKLPAYGPSTITLTKDGFAADTQKLNVKQNNMAHHVVLKRGGRRGR